jgi:hypothetical protein
VTSQYFELLCVELSKCKLPKNLKKIARLIFVNYGGVLSKKFSAVEISGEITSPANQIRTDRIIGDFPTKPRKIDIRLAQISRSPNPTAENFAGSWPRAPMVAELLTIYFDRDQIFSFQMNFDNVIKKRHINFEMDVDFDWDESIETLLQKYADESVIREYLHRVSFYNYKCLTTAFQLPVICLSALCGSFTFISKSYPLAEEIIINITGGTSILVSIISAVGSYLKLGETMSKHEVAEVAWQNFFNIVKHELSLRRELRTGAAEFLGRVQVDYKRLFEISPMISQSIINSTKKRLKGVDHEDFRVPNYLNGFSHTTVFIPGD